MKINSEFDQALPFVDSSASVKYPSRRTTGNHEGRQNMTQENDPLPFDEPENNRVDNFLATIDTFDEDLFYQDEFFAPSTEESHSNKPHSPNKTFSNNNFVRSLSNDFFLKQLIGEEANELAEYGRCAPPSPVVSNAMPGSGYPVIAPPEPMWHQQPQQMQMQYHPQPFIMQPCNVPNMLLPKGGFIQAQPHQQPGAAPIQKNMAGQQPPVATGVPTAMNNSMVWQQAQENPSRRTCSFPNCPNRIVQGGRCISHGAKRKTCSHPGCEKHVKKAGLCSAHGPARKRCEHEGCTKVAVQGGKCIAHGAKKRLCCIEECTKQGILGGMCKKHYDAVHGIVKVRAPRKKTKVLTHGRSTQYNGNACCA